MGNQVSKALIYWRILQDKLMMTSAFTFLWWACRAMQEEENVGEAMHIKEKPEANRMSISDDIEFNLDNLGIPSLVPTGARSAFS